MAENNGPGLVRLVKHRIFDAYVRPQIPFRPAYWLVFSLSAGFLLPWYAYVNAIDYFNRIWPDKHYGFVIAMAYNVPSFLGACVGCCSSGRRLTVVDVLQATL